jgi:hypothetical protein
MGKDHFEPASPTCLLLLRLWREELGNGQHEWRASVRDVINGEAGYVRTWAELERFLDSIASKQNVSKGNQNK